MLFNRFAHSAGPGIAPAAWEKGPQKVEKSTRPGSQKEPPASHEKTELFFEYFTVFSALFMAPTACESGSQEVEVSDARGSKNRSSGGQISPPPRVKFRSPGIPNGLLEPSWGVVGARSASGGRSGWERGRWKVVWRALGTVLESSWRLSTPWGGPGEAPGGHFWRYFGVIFGSVLGDQAEEVKLIIFQNFNVILDPFSILFIALCCLPCCVAGGTAHIQKT